MDERKYIGIRKDVHHQLLMIKLYGDLEINIVASELLSEAIENEEVLRKVLAKLFLNNKKVDHVVKCLKENKSI